MTHSASYKTLLPDQDINFDHPQSDNFWVDVIPIRIKEKSFYWDLAPWLLLEDVPILFGTRPASLNSWNSLIVGSLTYDREKYPLVQPPVLNDGITWPSLYNYLFPSSLEQYAQRGLDYGARTPGISWSPGITVGFYAGGIRTWLPANFNFGALMQPVVLGEPSRRTAPSGPSLTRELPKWLQD